MDSFRSDFLDVIFLKFGCLTGRAQRREFWMFQVWCLIVNIILIIMVFLWTFMTIYGGDFFIISIVFFNLGVIIPNITLGVRRLHDIGIPGWFMLFYLIGLGIVPMILSLLGSQNGENEYGQKI